MDGSIKMGGWLLYVGMREEMLLTNLYFQKVTWRNNLLSPSGLHRCRLTTAAVPPLSLSRSKFIRCRSLPKKKMEHRFTNSWRMTVNEKKFIETALLSDLRVDGRRPFDYRRLTIKFGREDGAAEVQLGHTHVMGVVTAQLAQPYQDRPNEGTLSIYTEFSPMADPSFEAGRPGESAVELGRIIDRGLRESRAVDTESLCVLSGKLVWAIRIDLHILDNGGNLVDAANTAALASLLTFRKPDCSLGGEDGQEVIVHPPEVREPLPLIIHHLPIAVTFAFFGDENIVVIDPTHYEEAIMRGRMTATLNTNGDVCAIQKPGGVGVMQSVVLQCLRIASVKASEITNKIRTAVESYDKERAFRKIKRHHFPNAVDISTQNSGMRDDKSLAACQKDDSRLHMDKLVSLESCAQNTDMEVEVPSEGGSDGSFGKTKSSFGAPSSWDPYSKGVDSEFLKASLSSRGRVATIKKQNEPTFEKQPTDAKNGQPPEQSSPAPSSTQMSRVGTDFNRIMTLEDAVKPKNRRKKKASAATNPSCEA
ncbi:hypothetical protein Nepgr_001867 [Nepenthes gracilis]|uniref:Protein ECERIFERUM 7 n=1 Tax=Nepenthes gracilis TaxID=150966 RepID=A0AAD3P5V8_NEPGR|nr:hypothetical protein Nepgr_001867 [Nepenthes gracilis]